MSLLIHHDTFSSISASAPIGFGLHTNQKYNMKPISKANQCEEIDCEQIEEARFF